MLLTTVIDGLVVAFFSFLFMCAYFFGAPFFWTFFFWLWRDQLHLMELLSYIVKVTLHIVKSKNRWCNLVDRTVHFVSLVPWWSSLTIFSNLCQFACFCKVTISTSLPICAVGEERETEWARGRRECELGPQAQAPFTMGQGRKGPYRKTYSTHTPDSRPKQLEDIENGIAEGNREL